MFEVLVGLTGIVIAAAMLVAYARTRDPLTPAVIFAPMLAFMYVYHPGMLLIQGDPEEFFTREQMGLVLTINLLGVLAFCLGTLHLRGAPRVWPGQSFMPFELTPSLQRKLYRLGVVMGLVASGTWILMVQRSGGFAEVFSTGKPHINMPSGYVSAVIMMKYPAIVLMALGRQGMRVRAQDVLLVVVAGLPHIVMGTIGGRRGPLFLIVCALAMWWFIVANRRPTLRTVLGGLMVLGLAMLFLLANRQHIHLGASPDDIDSGRFRDVVMLEERSTGDEFISGAATIVVADFHQRYYWGSRWAVQTLVRPIPSAIWPSQYRDVGFGWMERDAGTEGFTEQEWIDAMGFRPVRGSANGLVADFYLEFGWFGIAVCYLMGRLYVVAWRRSLTRGGLWVVIYIQMMGFSVYLVSQSFGAWSWRLMLIGVPTILLWNRMIEPAIRRLPLPGQQMIAPINETEPCAVPAPGRFLHGPEGRPPLWSWSR